MNVGADKNGLAMLEDFVEAGDADVGEILVLVMQSRLVNGVVNDVGNRADRHVDAEEIAAKFVDTAIGTVADEGQAEGGLPEPIFGHRQMEEHLIVGDGWRKGIGQGGLSAIAALIDKLAAGAR